MSETIPTSIKDNQIQSADVTTLQSLLNELQKLSPDQLKQNFNVMHSDGDITQLSEMEILGEDILINRDPHEFEDCGTKSDLEAAHGDDFNIGNYMVGLHAGTILFQ